VAVILRMAGSLCCPAKCDEIPPALPRYAARQITAYPLLPISTRSVAKAGNLPRTAIRLAIRAYNDNLKARVGSLENLDIANELWLRLRSERVTGDTGGARLPFDRDPCVPRQGCRHWRINRRFFLAVAVVVVALVQIQGCASVPLAIFMSSGTSLIWSSNANHGVA
jgi:hypothetical protein